MKETSEVSKASAMYNAAHTYKSGGFKGFAATLSKEQLEAVRNDPNVDYVEHDQQINMYEYLTQEDAPWGLARTSHAAKGADTYVYDDSAGEGTCVYMIDTGINIDHPDFEGRAEFLYNFTDGKDTDTAGHGTWTSGLVASKTYGVAKKSKVLALKVFGDDGTAQSSSVIAAMEYVIVDSYTRNCPSGYVANLSLGGSYSRTSNHAAEAMVHAGVFVAVAAGNSNVDAADKSPASAPLACTVGATDQDDARASFSNYGEIVDVWAPGVDLESTSYKGGNTTASGTSGSSPIVAGLGAYLMALDGTRGDRVCDRIKKLSIKDALSDIPKGSFNQLANNGAPEKTE
ncbi:hypothetical protein ACO1O0_009143 [Amphichorda felina]